MLLKTKTTVGVVAMLLAVLLLFSSCAGASIQGKWALKGEDYVIEFKDNGTAYSGGEYYGQYVVVGDTLVIEAIYSDDERYQFSIVGDKLTLSGSYGTQELYRVK